MQTQSHPLEPFFQQMVRNSYEGKLGLNDPDATAYVAHLLCEFSESDNLYKVRDEEGRPIEELSDMMLASDPVHGSASSFDAERAVRKHIGDYALFVAGMYPEATGSPRRLRRHQPSLGELIKAGKQIISLSDGAHVLAPQISADPARDRIVVVTTEGHLLMFSVAELPELDKGKGNKLIEVPKAKLVSGDERVAGIAVVAEGKGEVTLYAGQRKLTLKWSDLVEYGGNRASRGGLLPRGLRRVERIETTA